ncbi:MAG TPA: DUF5681 domain-containing protein [Bryobacteraceae bacterium]|nr:DUF5681 domain-containing protein [Bryobacteraceae bacterium]
MTKNGSKDNQENQDNNENNRNSQGQFAKGESGNPNPQWLNFGSGHKLVFNTDTDENNRNPQGQFAKGESGNPAGRPAGSRNKGTLFVEAMREGEGEAITRQIIESALAGNPFAQRIVMERMYPAPKERLINLPLPDIQTVEDARAALVLIFMAVGEGKITPGEGVKLAAIVASIKGTIPAQGKDDGLVIWEEFLALRRKIEAEEKALADAQISSETCGTSACISPVLTGATPGESTMSTPASNGEPVAIVHTAPYPAKLQSRFPRKDRARKKNGSARRGKKR